ncbi:MAG TPA: hypothetical protein VFZ83_13660 [Acidimicrobiia bacterium]|nr:hypothetical protein [Acidimicrobiia bacterium]
MRPSDDGAPEPGAAAIPDPGAAPDAGLDRRSFMRVAARGGAVASVAVWSAPRLHSVRLTQEDFVYPPPSSSTSSSSTSTSSSSTSSTSSTSTSSTSSTSSSSTTSTTVPCELLFDGSPAIVREFRYSEDDAPPNVFFSVPLTASDGSAQPFEISGPTSWATVSARAGTTPRTITFRITPIAAFQSAGDDDGGCEPGAIFCGEHTFTATSTRGGICTPATVTIRLVVVEGGTTVTIGSTVSPTTVPRTTNPPTTVPVTPATNPPGSVPPVRPNDRGRGGGPLPFTGTEAGDMVLLGGAAVILGRALLAVRNFLIGAADDEDDEEEEPAPAGTDL